MIINREINAIKGTFWGIIQKIVAIFFPFITRTAFIRVLGIEYLGLNSLFGSILQVLNLTELGISSALVFSMYQPIVEDDIDKICALMKLYKIYYRIIGVIILLIGLLLLPAIPYLIDGNIPEDINIYILYLLNLGSTVLSYWLFSYRNSLFNAFQRTDIQSIIVTIFNIIMYSLQLIFLYLFSNYYIYLITNIFAQILINICTALISKKIFPEFTPKGIISKVEKKEIFSKVKALVTAKIGGVVNHSADSIVISIYLGLQTLAIYQNYYYILSTLFGFFMIFYNSCEAGIANSLLVKNDNENISLFYKINHIAFFLLNFCCTSLICLYQPFMKLWVGDKYLLDFSMVILFSIYLFVEIAPRTLIVYKDAAGIWKKDQFRPLIVAITNLVINIILVKYIGLYGILISTILSMFIIGYPWLIYNTNQYLLKIGLKRYLKYLFVYSIIIIINVIITYLLCSFIRIRSLILVLLIRGVLCLTIPNITFLYILRNTTENKYIFDYFKRFLVKNKRR